ncbi:MAG: hypothetical protein KatS3mg023_2068 [Armatimonadota bacterium]|nr:MAG: hypothetical protein KatS3mg023_2068 [Armatimonadota bacterium]
MSGVYDERKTQIAIDGQQIEMPQNIRRQKKQEAEKMFYIPAQRVITIRDGLTRPFTDYRAGDPFVPQARRLSQSGLRYPTRILHLG